MKRLVIESFKQFQKANFYTVRFENEEISETDAFISLFEDDPLYQDDLGVILHWIYRMGNDTGTLERYFRLEGKAQAIPIVTSNLRLYCIRLSDEIVVLGNGGVKESQLVQDSPKAFPQFKDMNKVARHLRKSLQEGRTVKSGKSLTGVLIFEL